MKCLMPRDAQLPPLHLLLGFSFWWSLRVRSEDQLQREKRMLAKAWSRSVSCLIEGAQLGLQGPFLAFDRHT